MPSLKIEHNGLNDALRFKKLKAHKSAKGPGAQGTGFEAKARAFWTLGTLLLKNA